MKEIHNYTWLPFKQLEATRLLLISKSILTAAVKEVSWSLLRLGCKSKAKS